MKNSAALKQSKGGRKFLPQRNAEHAKRILLTPALFESSAVKILWLRLCQAASNCG